VHQGLLKAAPQLHHLAVEPYLLFVLERAGGVGAKFVPKVSFRRVAEDEAAIDQLVDGPGPRQLLRPLPGHESDAAERARKAALHAPELVRGLAVVEDAELAYDGILAALPSKLLLGALDDLLAEDIGVAPHPLHVLLRLLRDLAPQLRDDRYGDVGAVRHRALGAELRFHRRYHVQPQGSAHQHRREVNVDGIAMLSVAGAGGAEVQLFLETR
jgi:hypothetical protein